MLFFIGIESFRLQLSGSLDLAQDVLGQGLDGHAAAGGLGGEVLCVHLVESSKIAHVRQEAGGLDDLVKAAAGSLEDGANVLAALLSLSSDALADGAVSWDVMKPSEAPAEEVPAEEPAPSSFRLSVRDFRISDAFQAFSRLPKASRSTGTPWGAS